jgi:hypothetical protein
MPFSRQVPLNDLPLLPPEKHVFETVAVYKKLYEILAQA